MFSRRLKNGYFFVEGLNSFATVYYFYYFYFYMQKVYGFDSKANLLLAALNGVTYAIGAWQGGRVSQRIGYFSALKLGFSIMFVALTLGAFWHTAVGQVVAMLAVVFGMCFTWPTLEALVSEGEPAAVQHMVGVYNVVWAATGAVAYFVGGAMLDHLGLQSLFYVPMAIHVTQLSLVFWLESQARRAMRRESIFSTHPSHSPAEALQHEMALEARAHGPRQVQPAGFTAAAPERPASPGKAQVFLRMSWLANPFAYIAINTLIAAMPGVAHKLGLSTMLAGFCCSVWCFARLGAFLTLWLWNGWHYRFRWLLLAFLALIGSFAVILMVPHLAALVVAQLLFGGAVGLFYYSSLFYSMDLSDTKSEHGGIHEAIIGLGNFVGPSVGAASLHFLPQYVNSGAVAVSVLLMCGLGGLLALWRTGRRSAPAWNAAAVRAISFEQATKPSSLDERP